MATLTASDVADFILASVDEESGDNLSNLKLQKLVYYAQGFHLALTGQPLFDDPIHAWTHGPVVVSLYRKYQEYRSGAIPVPQVVDPARLDPETREIINEVMCVYGQFSAWKLREMTNAEPPWSETPLNGVITHDAMREFFKTLLVNNER